MEWVPANVSEKDDTRLSAKPSFELPGRLHLTPYQQGQLDHLCGLYSIVNGLRLLRHPTKPLSASAANILFDSGIAYLAAKDALPDALIDGMSARRWKHLAALLCDKASNDRHTINVEAPSPSSVRLAAPAIEEWIEQSVGAGWPVLLHLGHRHQHYTVICAIDHRHIWLFDSWGLTKLKRVQFVKRHDITASTMMRLTMQMRI